MRPILLVVFAGACIMPAHRRAATVVNGSFASVGLLGVVAASVGDHNSPGLDLSPEIRVAGAGLLVLALVGEGLSCLITPDDTTSAP